MKYLYLMFIYLTLFLEVSSININGYLWEVFVFFIQGFYVALCLVACAQSGQEVSVSSINLTVPSPKFVS